jgi:5,10-methylenetetrahydrofolate reductase
MAKLAQALADKKFVITVELDPPRGVAIAGLKALAAGLAGRVDAVVLSDNRGACPRQAPCWLAHVLGAHAGLEVIMTLTCRDRNRLALTSEMLAAAAAGVENLLLVSGDFVSLGDHPGAKPVYDLDSVQALQLATALMAGHDLGGQDLADAPTFFLGSSLAAHANPLGPQVMKYRKKLQAGADFFITQPLNALGTMEAFLDQAGEPGAPIIAGVEMGAPGEMEAKADLARRIKATGMAAGLHLSLPAAPAQLPAFLDACGL